MQDTMVTIPAEPGWWVLKVEDGVNIWKSPIIAWHIIKYEHQNYENYSPIPVLPFYGGDVEFDGYILPNGNVICSAFKEEVFWESEEQFREWLVQRWESEWRVRRSTNAANASE